MNISEEAVEAAAKAACIADNLGLDGAEAAWDDMGGSERSFERAGWEIAARAALEAAWAVMHPEVTTAEELDALPSGSIIMNASEQQVLRNYVGQDDPATWELMGALYQNDPVWSAHIIEFGPFTVIYRP